MSNSQSLEQAISAIITANPDVTANEARRVLGAISDLAQARHLPDAFIEFASGRVSTLAGNNACGGGNNACAARS